MTLPAKKDSETKPMSVGSRGLALRSLDDMTRFADLLIESGLAPKGQNKASVILSIQYGLEVGLSPMQSVQNVAVINGRPCVWGDAALGIAMAHRDFLGIDERIEGSGEEAVAHCLLKRRGRPDTERTFSVREAKHAKLWGKAGPWQQYPKRMLQMRARGFALRDAYPDALKGLYLGEELQGVEINGKHAGPEILPGLSDLVEGKADEAAVRDVEFDESTEPTGDPSVAEEPAEEPEPPSTMTKAQEGFFLRFSKQIEEAAEPKALARVERELGKPHMQEILGRECTESLQVLCELKHRDWGAAKGDMPF